MEHKTISFYNSMFLLFLSNSIVTTMTRKQRYNSFVHLSKYDESKAKDLSYINNLKVVIAAIVLTVSIIYSFKWNSFSFLCLEFIILFAIKHKMLIKKAKILVTVFIIIPLGFISSFGIYHFKLYQQADENSLYVTASLFLLGFFVYWLQWYNVVKPDLLPEQLRAALIKCKIKDSSNFEVSRIGLHTFKVKVLGNAVKFNKHLRPFSEEIRNVTGLWPELKCGDAGYWEISLHNKRPKKEVESINDETYLTINWDGVN